MDKLGAFEPHSMPVVSLYLNLTPDQHGRDNHDVFVRKAFAAHLKAFQPESAERASLERDVERIGTYLADDINRSTNGLALFSSAGSGEFFEAIQLDAPIDQHWLFIGSTPHLYPLARLIDQYPRYASVLLDTHRARIFVFALGAVERREHVTTEKTRRSAMGGWSQARYQRHADNVHLHHLKDVVEALDRIVRADNIQHIVIAGDDVVVPALKAQLPGHLNDRVVDVLRLERDADEDAIIEATLEVLRRKDAETDAEHVAELLGAWQSNGLGVVGPEATLAALELGQVEELLIAAAPQALRVPLLVPADLILEPAIVEVSGLAPGDELRVEMADDLVKRAQQTGARVRFIENPDLLRNLGGVGALLRFRV